MLFLFLKTELDAQNQLNKVVLKDPINEFSITFLKILNSFHSLGSISISPIQTLFKVKTEVPTHVLFGAKYKSQYCIDSINSSYFVSISSKSFFKI